LPCLGPTRRAKPTEKRDDLAPPHACPERSENGIIASNLRPQEGVKCPLWSWLCRVIRVAGDHRAPLASVRSAPETGRFTKPLPDCKAWERFGSAGYAPYCSDRTAPGDFPPLGPLWPASVSPSGHGPARVAMEPKWEQLHVRCTQPRDVDDRSPRTYPSASPRGRALPRLGIRGLESKGAARISCHGRPLRRAGEQHRFP
jgi:hypothetical protein